MLSNVLALGGLIDHSTHKEPFESIICCRFMI